MDGPWLVSLVLMLVILVVLAIACWIPLGRWFMGPVERGSAAFGAAIVVFLLPYFALRLGGGIVVVEDDDDLVVTVVAVPKAAWTVTYRWVLGTDQGITRALLQPTPSASRLMK